MKEAMSVAERARLYRARKKRRVVFLAAVELTKPELSWLYGRGFITYEQKEDPEAVAAAIKRVLQRALYEERIGPNPKQMEAA